MEPFPLPLRIPLKIHYETNQIHLTQVIFLCFQATLMRERTLRLSLRREFEYWYYIGTITPGSRELPVPGGLEGSGRRDGD